MDIAELAKPRITLMVILSTAGGYLMAKQGPLSTVQLAHALFGTAWVAVAASVLNQWLERDTDLLMARTQDRPIAAGRISPNMGFLIGTTLGAMGTVYLAIMVNALTAGLGLFTLLLYVLAYTPMKRVSSLCTIVGAVPGALPPVIGWAAARDDLSTGAWVLFAILFLWQMPHFLAIAWMYRDEYQAGGQPMLTVGDPDGASTGRQIVLYCLALLPVSLLPSVIGLTQSLYFAGALLLGLTYLGAGAYAGLRHSDSSARLLLRVSIIYLPLLLGLMAMDRVNS